MESPHTSGIERPPVALCHAHADVKKHFPDFLIISPPKTGSTWLAANLQCHPNVFVPPIKEVKYFSMYHRWLDLDWYAEHFRAAGMRLKGEASPSYALLPCGMIRWLHSLMPHVKLVFLLRDPVARAWSHARHNYRYHEANFASYRGSLESVPEEMWRASLRHPWVLGSGDYLGQLRRWLNVFPREQIYVDWYERLVTDPEGLFLNVLTFLGVQKEQLDWSTFRLKETILPGVDKALSPALAGELRMLLQDRTRQLESFLGEELTLSAPQPWENTLGSAAAGQGSEAGSESAEEVFARAFDDEYLADLLDTEVHSSDPQLVVEGYHGYNLVLHRGRFLALAQSLGDINREALHTAVARGRDGPGILLGDSLAHLKERVVEHVVQKLAQHVEKLQAHQREVDAALFQSVTFIALVQNSLAFRFQAHLGRWLTGGAAFLRNALGRLKRLASGGCLPPGDEQAVNTPRSPSLGVLPQKPP